MKGSVSPTSFLAIHATGFRRASGFPTCIARQSVFSMMRTNMMYSNPVEFTTYQNLYW